MKDRELMQQALEAMEFHTRGDEIDEALIAALRERLAQPERELVCVCGAIWEGQELVSTPPQRKPLTDEQIMANDVLRYHFALNGGAGPISKKGRKVIDAIEAAHGIKENT